MKSIVVPSFLGPLEIKWSDLGLEKIDIAVSSPPVQATKDLLPPWMNLFLKDFNLYLNNAQAMTNFPPVNDSKWTVFQRQIYYTLFNTKPGETLTYGDLAKKCSRPNAARSVGAAMSRNTLPILIPCHRVLPAGGKLGNYTGGEGPLSKEKLLNFEQKFQKPQIKRRVIQVLTPRNQSQQK